MRVTVATAGLFHADRLAAGLARDGHNCTLVVGCAAPQRHGVSVRSLPLIGLLERGLSRAVPRHRSAFQRAAKLLFDRWVAIEMRRLCPDLLIGWSSSVFRALAVASARGTITALERGSTHVDTQYELLQEEFARWGFRAEPVDRWTRAREIGGYNQAAWITVPSTFARDSFLARGWPAERLEVVPMGVDTERFRPAPPADSRFRVLFVGLVDLRKGVPYLLQAYERVASPATDLLIVGPRSSAMRQLTCSLGVSHRYVGTKSNEGIATLMARARALVVPSIEEGLARVILEGMACAIPVIATVNSGGADVVSDGVDGFVVPPRDVDVLADRLRFLRDHPDQASIMGAKARAKVQRGFTWEHYGQRVAEVMRRRTA